MRCPSQLRVCKKMKTGIKAISQQNRGISLQRHYIENTFNLTVVESLYSLWARKNNIYSLMPDDRSKNPWHVYSFTHFGGILKNFHLWLQIAQNLATITKHDNCDSCQIWLNKCNHKWVNFNADICVLACFVICPIGVFRRKWTVQVTMAGIYFLHHVIGRNPDNRWAVLLLNLRNNIFN